MPEPFLVCPLGCVYVTPADLIDTYNAVIEQDVRDAIENGWVPVEYDLVDDTEQVHWCPLCGHEL